MGRSWVAGLFRHCRPRHKTDGAGLVVSSAAIALLTYTLVEAPNYGWSAGHTLAGFAVVAGLFVAFIIRERSAAEPLVDVASSATFASPPPAAPSRSPSSGQQASAS